MSLLTSADYPAIRAALDVHLDSTLLPDSIIALNIYQGAAEMEVKRRDPLAETRTGDDATRVRLAAIYLCAAALAPAIPRLVSQTLDGHTVTVDGATWRDLAARLTALAYEHLQTVTSVTPQVGAFHFARAAGGRGKW